MTTTKTTDHSSWLALAITSVTIITSFVFFRSWLLVPANASALFSTYLALSSLVVLLTLCVRERLTPRDVVYSLTWPVWAIRGTIRYLVEIWRS